jgi:gamma-glutamylcyclotransferase (GGCT)/AIG2-like uncharacterized protein YtfP
VIAVLYFAYGMNTNVNQMQSRCPGAARLGHARLIDHVFRFAQHADVIKHRGCFVDGVLWEINNTHLKSLDILEGYPYYYNRRELRVAYQDRIVNAVCYYMQPGHLDRQPSSSYFDLVVEGYQQNMVPTDQLYNFVD